MTSVSKHAAGKASRYTASRLPVELAFAPPMPDRGAAMREEARIKRLARPQKLDLVDATPCERSERVGRDLWACSVALARHRRLASCSTAPSGGSLSSSVAEPVKLAVTDRGKSP